MRRKQLSIRAKMTVFQNIPEVIACQNIPADLKVGFYQVYHFPKDPVLKHCQVVVAKGSGELFLSLLIFFSWTTRPNWTKLGSDTPWMDLYQNCVQCLMANKASDRLKMGNLLPSSSSKTTASNEMKFESRSPWVVHPLPSLCSLSRTNFPTWLLSTNDVCTSLESDYRLYWAYLFNIQQNWWQ